MSNPYAVDFSPIAQGIDKFKKKRRRKNLDNATAMLEQVAEDRVAVPGKAQQSYDDLADDPTALQGLGPRMTDREVAAETAIREKEYGEDSSRGLSRDQMQRTMSKLSDADQQKVMDRFEKKNRTRQKEQADLQAKQVANKASEHALAVSKKTDNANDVLNRSVSLAIENSFDEGSMYDSPNLKPFLDSYRTKHGLQGNIIENGLVYDENGGPDGKSGMLTMHLDNGEIEQLTDQQMSAAIRVESMGKDGKMLAGNMAKMAALKKTDPKLHAELVNNPRLQTQLHGLAIEPETLSQGQVYINKDGNLEVQRVKAGGIAGKASVVKEEIDNTVDLKKAELTGASNKADKAVKIMKDQVESRQTSNRKQLSSMKAQRLSKYLDPEQMKVIDQATTMTMDPTTWKDIKPEAEKAIGKLRDAAGLASIDAKESKGTTRKRHEKNAMDFEELAKKLEEEYKLWDQLFVEQGKAAASYKSSAGIKPESQPAPQKPTGDWRDSWTKASGKAQGMRTEFVTQ